MRECVIEAGHTERRYWTDLWQYRELPYFLAWRDLLVRYKQTVVGASWAVIRPALTMVVLTVVFRNIARLPSDGIPYPILVFCGMLPWQFFSSAFTESSGSLVANSSMISKVYFPRLAVPVSSVATAFADFLVSCSLLVALMLWYGFTPARSIVVLPLFVLLAIAASLAMGIWFSALSVRYRDFRYVVPFLAQLGLYISPVGFSSSVVPPQWRLIYSLNPMAGVIDGFRWSILGGTSPIYWPGVGVAALVVAVTLVIGIRYFRATERTFADII
jgi:lipopolysaccharide transport system permease protein